MSSCKAVSPRMSNPPELEAQDLSGEVVVRVQEGNGRGTEAEDAAVDASGNVEQAQQPKGRPEPGTPSPA